MAKKGKRRKFKGGVSRNAAKQARGSQFGHLNLPKNLSVFKEEPGRMSLDILPYEVSVPNHLDRDDEYEVAIPGELWYKRPYYLHRNIGPNNDAVICPSTIKKPCPICEYRAQLMKDGKDWDDDSVKALKASMRNLYVVIPKGHEKYDEVPHVWDISQFLFQNKLNEEIGESEEYETFPDLEDGYTLKIRFSEESLGSNKFNECSRIDFLERNEPYDDSILDEVPSLDALLEVSSYSVLEAVFFGGMNQDEAEEEEKGADGPGQGDEEEEDDRPQRSSRTSHRRKREEAPEDDPEDEEPEEEKKPPRRSGRDSSGGREKDKEKDDKKNKCPHGHKFGKDCEQYDECDKCDKWEDCLDVAEAGK